jgi:hypothetical protein
MWSIWLWPVAVAVRQEFTVLAVAALVACCQT